MPLKAAYNIGSLNGSVRLLGTIKQETKLLKLLILIDFLINALTSGKAYV